MDQVMAIENGGDDFITKTFSYDVLLAKLKEYFEGFTAAMHLVIMIMCD